MGCSTNISDFDKTMTPQTPTWQAENLRLTIFTAPQTSPLADVSTWWEKVVGSPSDVQTSSSKTKSHQEEGAWGNDRLVLRVQSHRIDWVLAPTPDNDPEDLSFLSVGKFNEAIVKFIELSNKCLALAPKIQRIALGTVLIFPVSTVDEGYKAIYPLIEIEGLLKSPGRVRDFLLQINRPVKSNTHEADLQINRLSKWSVASIRKIQLITGIEIATSNFGPEMYACRLELDISSALEYEGEITNPKNLLGEFKDIALAISTSGYGEQ